MENEKQAILDAHAEVLANLNMVRDVFLSQLEKNPKDYEGVTKEHAFVWFIEAM